jgi:hypothetical protein
MNQVQKKVVEMKGDAKDILKEIELFMNEQIPNVIEWKLKGIVDKSMIKRLLITFKDILTIDTFTQKIPLFYALDYTFKHYKNSISNIHQAYKRAKHFVKDKKVILDISNLPKSKTPFESFYEQLDLINEIYITSPSQINNFLNPFVNVDFSEVIKNNSHPLKKMCKEWCKENNISIDKALEFLQNDFFEIDCHIKWSEYFNEKYENYIDQINCCEKNYLLLISLISWANNLNHYCDNNKVTEQPEEYLWIFQYYLDWYEKILHNANLNELIK